MTLGNRAELTNALELLEWVRQRPQAQLKVTFADDRNLTESGTSIEGIWRPLDTSEALFGVFNAAGVFLTAQALGVHGPVTETLLLEAFTHIEKRHPLLHARILSCGDKLYWAEGAAMSPRSPSSMTLLQGVWKR
jgi:hypothetical protein